MSEKIKKRKIERVPIEVKDEKGEYKTVGHYYPKDKLFKCTRKKSEDYMRKLDAWGIDANVVKYLVKETSSIELRDTENKWTFSCKASDFLVHGSMEEVAGSRAQYYLNIKKWKVLKASSVSSVLKCMAVCKFNIYGNCIRGTIEITEKGECLNLE